MIGMRSDAGRFRKAVDVERAEHFQPFAERKAAPLGEFLAPHREIDAVQTQELFVEL